VYHTPCKARAHLGVATQLVRPPAAGKAKPVAIYHCSVKAISRSAGRSATAAAAYRAGEKILDTRSGEEHDYTRKQGVESTTIIAPNGALWAFDRAALWNLAEHSEKRKDACVAREIVLALPAELDAKSREKLALDFARELVQERKCAADVSIHAPSRGGDDRNHHAHILMTTRKVEVDGLGQKCDQEKAGRDRKADLEHVRERAAALINERLREAGIDAHVDHRSLKDQGYDEIPLQHLGPEAVALERRGIDSFRGDRNAEISAENARRETARAKAQREEKEKVEQREQIEAKATKALLEKEERENAGNRYPVKAARSRLGSLVSEDSRLEKEIAESIEEEQAWKKAHPIQARFKEWYDEGRDANMQRRQALVDEIAAAQAEAQRALDAAIAEERKAQEQREAKRQKELAATEVEKQPGAEKPKEPVRWERQWSRNDRGRSR